MTTDNDLRRPFIDAIVSQHSEQLADEVSDIIVYGTADKERINFLLYGNPK